LDFVPPGLDFVPLNFDFVPAGFDFLPADFEFLPRVPRTLSKSRVSRETTPLPPAFIELRAAGEAPQSAKSG